jgi:hypothetical protein
VFARLADALRSQRVVSTRSSDELIVERWRLEPRYVLEFDESVFEKAPPLWQDLMLAAIFVLVLLGAAVALFG